MGFAMNTVKLCGSLVFNLGKCGNEPARYLTWGWGEVCYRSLRGFARTFRAIGAHPAYACVYLYAHVHIPTKSQAIGLSFKHLNSISSSQP